MSWARGLAILVAKDARIEWRTREILTVTVMLSVLFVVVAVLLLSLSPAYATCGGGGGGGMGGTMPSGMGQPQAYVVPWKILKPDEAPVSAPLIVYWFPATKEEVKGHELMSSRALTLSKR